MTPETIEQKAYEILSDRPYTLTISGEEIKFKYLTLDDLEHISALASGLPTVDAENHKVHEVFGSFSSAPVLKEIIMLTVDIKISINANEEKDEQVLIEEEKRRIRSIIGKAKIVEVWSVVQAIMQKNHVFFYLDAISSLKGINLLKQTKETDRIVLGR